MSLTISVVVGLSLRQAVHDLEARLIGQALDETGGSVTRAAKLLGMGHQTLAHMLKGRHRGLAGKRTPPKRRRKSIIRKSGSRKKKRGPPASP